MSTPRRSESTTPEEALIEAFNNVMKNNPYALWTTFHTHNLDKFGAAAILKEMEKGPYYVYANSKFDFL